MTKAITDNKRAPSPNRSPKISGTVNFLKERTFPAILVKIIIPRILPRGKIKAAIPVS